MHAWELEYDLLFAAYSLRVLRVKQMRLILLFVVILYKSSPSVCHLIQSIHKSFSDLMVNCRSAIARSQVQVKLIGLLPNVVSHKFVYWGHLLCLDWVYVDEWEYFDETGNVLNQNVITCDHDFLRARFRWSFLVGGDLSRFVSLLGAWVVIQFAGLCVLGCACWGIRHALLIARPIHIFSARF